jgi:glycine/serine hydroxymethyltransferase
MRVTGSFAVLLPAFPALPPQSFPYKLDPATGLVDMDKLEERATEYRPRLIICGGSAYSRDWCARF